LVKTCQTYYQTEYQNNQRLVFLHNKDYFVKNDTIGLILKNLQIILNETDISNCFVTVVTSVENIEEHKDYLSKLSSDENKITFITSQEPFTVTHLSQHPFSRDEQYQYGSVNPVKIALSDLSVKEKYLIGESKRFCMYPWIHLHAWPTGEAYPCCHAKPDPTYGNSRKQSLAEIWNGPEMRKLRVDMLNEVANKSCSKCYEQEDVGFFSGRKSANKHHGHHIGRIHHTNDDGSLDQFQMTYWDIRYSNLCNLSCRSCGHIFSSSWYQDQAKLAGGDWTQKNKPLNFAGRTEVDMWEQLIPHLDYVEQIYFAGGEPLMMDEHYNILDELERRGRFDVRLIYNTNFTHVKLKDRLVFEYWKKFENVAVGASLDGMGPRAEYIRKGTDWDVIERNRNDMLNICPEVDFYISPTLSIFNALHVPDFHRDWANKGYIKAQDVNINVLQDPIHYRLDIANRDLKAKIKDKYAEHLEWLKPLDKLHRATQGYESAINYMMANDNSHLIPTFWENTKKLDAIRKEDVLSVLPELAELKQ
jgi:MoaA/NifB/PqqE/SkfB family radical SAM enzyme